MEPPPRILFIALSEIIIKENPATVQLPIKKPGVF